MASPIQFLPYFTALDDAPQAKPEPSFPTTPENTCALPFGPASYFKVQEPSQRLFFNHSKQQRLTLALELFSAAQVKYLDNEFKNYIQDKHPNWIIKKIEPHSSPYARNYAYEITLPNRQNVLVEKYEENLVIEFPSLNDRDVFLYTTQDYSPSNIAYRLTAVDTPGFGSGHHIHVYDHKLRRWSASIVLNSQPNTQQVFKFLEGLVKSRSDWEVNHQHLLFEIKDPTSTFAADYEELQKKVATVYQRSDVPESRLYRFIDETHGGEYMFALVKSALAKGYSPGQILNFKFHSFDGEISFRELLEQQRFRLTIITDQGSFPLMRYERASRWTGQSIFSDEQDSYQFLLLLMKLTPNSEWKKTWPGFAEQDLSINVILQEIDKAHSQENFHSFEHDVHHFIEVLIPYYRGSGKDLNQLKQRLLKQVTKAEIKPNNTSIVAHQMESLGLLLNAPEITWTPEEQQQVKDWIAKVNRWTAKANLTELFDSEVIHLYRGYDLIQKSSHDWAKR